MRRLCTLSSIFCDVDFTVYMGDTLGSPLLWSIYWGHSEISVAVARSAIS